MKTVFITIFSGNGAKYILRSDIYRTMIKNEEIRLVFFVKNQERAEYYRREFSNHRMIFEAIADYQFSFTDRLFSFFKRYLLRSKTIDLKRLRNYEDSGNWLRFSASFLANRILARPWVRKIIRFLDQYLVKNNQLVSYFEKYNPQMLLVTDVFDDREASFIREAKKRKIVSVGLILSWDRVTSRWMTRLLADKYIVHNDIMKQEMETYCDVKKDKIFISGAIQFDYLKTPLRSLREEFYRQNNIPLDNKIILFGPIGRSFDKTKELDFGLIEKLDSWIAEKRFGDHGLTLIVRFPPNDFVETDKLTSFAHVIYQIPGMRFSQKRGADWDMTNKDLELLKETLYYSSLVICFYSSLSIDAAFADKPVININFNIKDKEIISQPHHYYQTTHYSQALATGGLKLVKNEQELIEALKNYFENPSLDKAGRERLVASQCFKTDGQSGQRAAEFLLAWL